MTGPTRDELQAAKRALAEYGFDRLMTKPISNPKLAKGLAKGIMSAPLHLAPSDLSGWNVCPMATRGCIKACLHTAGNPAAMTGKDRARKARTRAFFEARPAFMVVLAGEIAALVRAADKAGMIAAIRLNATSDIRWETIPVVFDGRTYQNMMTAFPDVVFYDYTKIANRRNLPRNYRLTFSLAESNEDHAGLALRNGHNVAIVFDTKRNRPLPDCYTVAGITYRVIDGDVDDFRPSDPSGVIVGLRAKGKAIGDASGFVRKAA